MSNTKEKIGAASHIPSSASTTQARHSTRLLGSSSKMGSGEKRVSAKDHNNEESTTATRPKRSATAAANALLQQLQISEDEELEDPDGELNNETDNGTDFEDPDGEMELDDESDEGSGDDDGSDIEVVDQGKIKPMASATQKGKGPAASHHVQRKPKPPIDEDPSSDETGES